MMDRLEALKQHYLDAAERMRDLPIFNDKLAVTLVGFDEWQTHKVGVLLTPWFMNLIILPAQHDAWGEQVVGEKHLFSLPSGVYECIHNVEPTIGTYLSCSLFSPMSEFNDQEAAEATAQAVIEALFVEAYQAPTDRQVALKQQKEAEEQKQLEQSRSENTQERRIPEKVTRRGFLTAGLSGKEPSGQDKTQGGSHA